MNNEHFLLSSFKLKSGAKLRSVSALQRWEHEAARKPASSLVLPSFFTLEDDFKTWFIFCAHVCGISGCASSCCWAHWASSSRQAPLFTAPCISPTRCHGKFGPHKGSGLRVDCYSPTESLLQHEFNPPHSARAVTAEIRHVSLLDKRKKQIINRTVAMSVWTKWSTRAKIDSCFWALKLLKISSEIKL